MKKVIDGKVYNTETAERVACYDNGVSCRDFGFCEEDLYKTRKGAFFVHGEGGALSVWSQSCGSNGRCGGSGIEVLSKKEALAWCEEHGVGAFLVAWYGSHRAAGGPPDLVAEQLLAEVHAEDGHGQVGVQAGPGTLQ